MLEETIDEVLLQPEWELELNSLESQGELQVNTLSQHPTNLSAERPNQGATTSKDLNITKTNAVPQNEGNNTLMAKTTKTTEATREPLNLNQR